MDIVNKKGYPMYSRVHYCSTRYPLAYCIHVYPIPPGIPFNGINVTLAYFHIQCTRVSPPRVCGKNVAGIELKRISLGIRHQGGRAMCSTVTCGWKGDTMEMYTVIN